LFKVSIEIYETAGHYKFTLFSILQFILTVRSERKYGGGDINCHIIEGQKLTYCVHKITVAS